MWLTHMDARDTRDTCDVCDAFNARTLAMTDAAAMQSDEASPLTSRVRGMWDSPGGFLMVQGGGGMSWSDSRTGARGRLCARVYPLHLAKTVELYYDSARPMQDATPAPCLHVRSRARMSTEAAVSNSTSWAMVSLRSGPMPHWPAAGSQAHCMGLVFAARPRTPCNHHPHLRTPSSCRYTLHARIPQPTHGHTDTHTHLLPSMSRWSGWLPFAARPSTACCIASSAACRMLIVSMTVWSTTALEGGTSTAGHNTEKAACMSRWLKHIIS